MQDTATIRTRQKRAVIVVRCVGRSRHAITCDFASSVKDVKEFFFATAALMLHLCSYCVLGWSLPILGRRLLPAVPRPKLRLFYSAPNMPALRWQWTEKIIELVTSSKKKCVGHVFAIFNRRDQQVCVTEEMHQCVHHYFKSFGKTLRISCANVHSKSGGKSSPRPNPNEHPSAHVRHCEIPQWSKAKNMHACVDLKGVAGPFLSSDLTMLSVTYELTPHVRTKQTTGHPDELDQ